MREITTHKVNGVNDGITLTAVDDPGCGAANHEYCLQFQNKHGSAVRRGVIFQNGPIKDAGINGVTHEVLLAVIIDRLKGFQSGPYECDDNAEAMEHCEAALECLQRRTRQRLARGVEGTHTV